MEIDIDGISSANSLSEDGWVVTHIHMRKVMAPNNPRIEVNYDYKFVDQASSYNNITFTLFGSDFPLTFTDFMEKVKQNSNGIFIYNVSNSSCFITSGACATGIVPLHNNEEELIRYRTLVLPENNFLGGAQAKTKNYIDRTTFDKAGGINNIPPRTSYMKYDAIYTYDQWMAEIHSFMG